MPEDTVTINYQAILITALITAFVTLLVTRFGNVVLSVLLWPFLKLYDMIYYILVPMSPEIFGFGAYRRDLCNSKLAIIETPIQAKLEVPLRTAYAPLRLLSRDEERPIDLFQFVLQSKRMLVLGGPGTGKTTLMKSLIMAIVYEKISDPLKKCIPVFITLRDIATNKQTIESAIYHTMQSKRFPRPKKFIDAGLQNGRFIVILDGLDEVGISRKFVAQQILAFCETDRKNYGSSNRIIVTCREQSYQSRDLSSEIPEIVRVEPFSNDHMRTFLSGWPKYRGKAPIRLFKEIQKDNQILDVCRNPLLLTILTGLYLEVDDFETPTSREKFYDSAIRELLLFRPGRRQIEQKFKYEDKISLLSRICLDKLETRSEEEDPEALNNATFDHYGPEVFGDHYDRSELVDELIETNGILKRAGNVYTFLHRTIQEFLAAREATRVRDADAVVATCRERSELQQVLNFYSGMLKNVPLIEHVLNLFVREEDWLQAGECLANVTESPSPNIAANISDHLASLASEDAPESMRAAELLSTLSQRRLSAYDPARKSFEGFIDGLTRNQDTSILYSALSTNPDMAKRVYPGLLSHSSKEWQSVGVRVLKNLGTDEAIDELVGLLKEKGKSVRREEAAFALADIMRVRATDLIDRKELFSQYEGSGIWPLGRFFPRNVALHIADGVGKPYSGNNPLIEYAISSMHDFSDNKSSDVDATRRNWLRLGRDIRLNSRRIQASIVLQNCCLAMTLCLIFVPLLTSVYARISGNAVIVDATAIQITRLPRHDVNLLVENAAHIKKAIERSYPLTGKWWHIFMPWKWVSYNDISEPKYQELYEKVIKISANFLPRITYLSNDPILSPNDLVALTELGESIGEMNFGDFYTEYIDIWGHTRGKDVFVSGRFFPDEQFSLMVPLGFAPIILLFAIVVGRRRTLIGKSMERSGLSSNATFITDLKFEVTMSFILLVFLFSITLFVYGTFMALVIAVPANGYVASLLIRYVVWPKNQLFHALTDGGLEGLILEKEDRLIEVFGNSPLKVYWRKIWLDLRENRFFL